MSSMFWTLPMDKTCYFCELLKYGFTDCENGYVETASCDKDGFEKHASLEWCKWFIPNTDWLYIEQLEKENEELMRKIQSYQYEREKWHGYLANIPNNPSVDSLNQMSISNRYVYDPIIGGYVTKESKDEVKEWYTDF